VKSPVVFWLGGIVAILAVVATATGLLVSSGAGERTFTTVRGATVHLYGSGLYRLDTVFNAAGQRGTDLITLALGVPLIVACLVFYRRGSLRAGLLLVGAFAYFLYVYASLALGYAFNQLFLVYVALFAASLYGLILLIRDIHLEALPEEIVQRLPRRGPAAFMAFSGLVVIVVWLQPVVAALLSGDAPARMDSYTTAMTYALDLAVIAPALFICAVLLLRGRPLGYLLGFPLLGIIMLLGPAIAAQTVSQVRAGVHLTPGEQVGPVVGFLVVCAWAIWVAVSILRRLPARRPAADGAVAEEALTPVD
jgi:hypothetical protein